MIMVLNRKFDIFELNFVFQTFHESYILQIVTLHWHMVFVSWVSLNVMKVRFLACNSNEKKEKNHKFDKAN